MGDPHPLQGCRRRQLRAIEHYKVLEAELSALPDDSKAVTFRSEYDSEAQNVTAYIATVPKFPAHWGLIASEALFNARCALDYLAWELARWNLQQKGETRDPDGRTQFPIATRADLFKERQVSDLDPHHVAEIERLQPYSDEMLNPWLAQYPPNARAQMTARMADPGYRESAARLQPLAKLMLINDHDKHRVLRPIASYMAGGEIRSGTPSDCEITLQNFFLQYQLNEGTEWAVYTVTPMGPNPKVEVRDRVNIGVTFGDFNFVPDFKRVVNAVNEVVETFLPVFGPEET